MVCDRCILVVRQVLEALHLHATYISLGHVQFSEPLTPTEQTALDGALISVGFERIDDRKARLIEQIKKIVIERIHHQGHMHLKTNWSSILAEELHVDYHSLSSLFSAAEGITLEHFVIKQKIERVKELLLYDELNLSQIASNLGYSSVAHLSAQFKKITGLTPSELKKARTTTTRKSIDSIH